MSLENVSKLNWPLFIIVSAILHFAILSVIVLCSSGQDRPNDSALADTPEMRTEGNVQTSAQHSDSNANPSENLSSAVENASASPVSGGAGGSAHTSAGSSSNASTSGSGARSQGNNVNSPAGGNTIDYVVAAGDSLTRIAKRHKCTVTELAKLNNLKPTSGLRIGQRIKLPSPAN